jgi:CheY-like chemotaxis protein
MTRAQVAEYLEKTQEITEAVTSKKEAIELLAKGGFCTKKGELKKIYRSE